MAHNLKMTPRDNAAKNPNDSAPNVQDGKQKSFHAGAAALRELPLEARGADCLIVFEELRPLGISYSRVHLRRLEKEKKFPPRVRLSERRVAWRVADIREFLQALGTEGKNNG